jgi:hypothetical protein
MHINQPVAEIRRDDVTGILDVDDPLVRHLINVSKFKFPIYMHVSILFPRSLPALISSRTSHKYRYFHVTLTSNNPLFTTVIIVVHRLQIVVSILM